jgi:hypothetical protein
MVGPVILATLVGWGPRALSPPPEPRCPAPAPCVCICQGTPRTTSPPKRAIVEAARAEPVEYQRYSAPIMLADVLSIGAMMASISTKSEGLLFAGAAGYSLAAPINHIANGRPGRAAASFGLRALALGLATGAFIGEIVARGCDGDVNPCGPPTAGIGIGTLVTAGIAILDDALLARKPLEPTKPPSSATLSPGVVAGRNGALLSLSGRF